MAAKLQRVESEREGLRLVQEVLGHGKLRPRLPVEAMLPVRICSTLQYVSTR